MGNCLFPCSNRPRRWVDVIRTKYRKWAIIRTQQYCRGTRIVTWPERYARSECEIAALCRPSVMVIWPTMRR